MSMYDCAVCNEPRCSHVIDDNHAQIARIQLAEKCMAQAWRWITLLEKGGEHIEGALKEYRETYPKSIDCLSQEEI